MNTEVERFWARVQKSDEPDGCWLWTGPKNKSRYGLARFGGRTVVAHRLAWILCIGPTVKELNVCHNCPGGDNPSCVNPDHLFLGTTAMNIADYRRKQAPIKEAQQAARHAAYMRETAARELAHLCVICGARGAAMFLFFGAYQPDGSYVRGSEERHLCVDVATCLRRVCVLGAA